MFLLGILYGLGLICYPIMYGILTPEPTPRSGEASNEPVPINLEDVFWPTVFWPVIVAFFILGAIAHFSLCGLVAVGRELRAKCEAFYGNNQ